MDGGLHPRFHVYGKLLAHNLKAANNGTVDHKNELIILHASMINCHQLLPNYSQMLLKTDFLRSRLRDPTKISPFTFENVPREAIMSRKGVMHG